MKEKDYKKNIEENIEPIDIYDKVKDFAYNKDYSYNECSKVKKANYKNILRIGISFACIVLVFTMIVVFSNNFSKMNSETDASFENDPADNTESKNNNSQNSEIKDSEEKKEPGSTGDNYENYWTSITLTEYQNKLNKYIEEKKDDTSDSIVNENDGPIATPNNIRSEVYKATYYYSIEMKSSNCLEAVEIKVNNLTLSEKQAVSNFSKFLADNMSK